MADIDVLKELLDWSASRHAWQRDALRRLVSNGELSSNDIEELADICKSSYGLIDKKASLPLEAKHLPDRSASMQPVILKSLTHHDGVNALGKNQTIEFGPTLTVVYGANAAGKSGYTRILKQACRARGAEDILGNVVAGTAPGRPSATIQFDVGGAATQVLWGDDETGDAALGTVSVFDRHCASVYVSEKTDVAFRPLGLDLFDKLSNACEEIRKVLERERKQLAPSALPLVPDVPEGTQVHTLMSHLTSLTDPDSVRQLASLSDIERAELEELRRRLQDANADDPTKTAQVLDLRAKRIDSLTAHIKSLLEAATIESIRAVFDARDKMDSSAQRLSQLRDETFAQQPLPGTGSATWREMWTAAGRFSTAEAYPADGFPVVGTDARCVLCQQAIDAEAAERFRGFQDFLTSQIQRDCDADTRTFQQRAAQLRDLRVATEETTLAIEELGVEDSELGGRTEEFLAAVEDRQKLALSALDNGEPFPAAITPATMDLGPLESNSQHLRQRASELRQGSDKTAKQELSDRIAELEAREVLGTHVQAVLDEITRQKKIAAYQLCLEETKTTGVTRKSSEVTERAVTKQLATSFAEELKTLKFRHIEVELKAAGGARGSLFHKLSLKRAPGISVPKVVSEGEARCLSIASFFAELSTTSDRSTILFDDPVSSLDHNWRENVAHRLVLESRTRQVVVFTHDIVFLLSLMAHTERLGVSLKHQYLRRDGTGAGLVAKQLPWPAMKVKSRLGHLRSLFQDAAKQHRTGNQSVYESQAATIYGLLRESWERAIEEVLLGGVVERYRNSVQTQQAACLADITPEDCRTLEDAMTKCSRWLPGHDQAAAENAPFPEPSELEADIEELQKWIDEIRKRRKT